MEPVAIFSARQSFGDSVPEISLKSPTPGC